MKLFLLRHGDAIEQGYDDASRPLSPLGEEQARTAAATLRKHTETLDLILSSPLVRAQQMAKIVQKQFPSVNIQTTEHLVSSSDPRQIIQLLNELKKNSVLCVGHQPHLGLLLSQLTDGKSHEVKKGTLACIEIALPMKRGEGKLEWVKHFEQIKKKDS
jgi:phosphohistidine phosphatase